jgi:hypothetical protein
MAIGTIKIDKIREEKNKGLYKISTEDYNSPDFYVEIDKNDNKLRFFSSSDLKKQDMYEIDYNNKEQIIVPFSGVPKQVFFNALSKLFKILKSDEFPEKLSYVA